MHKFIFRVICAEITAAKALRAMPAGCPGAPVPGGESPGCAPTRAPGPRQWLCRHPAAESAGFQGCGAGGTPLFFSRFVRGGVQQGEYGFFVFLGFFLCGDRAQASRGKAPSRNIPERQRSRTRRICKQRTRLLRTAASPGTLRSLSAAPRLPPPPYCRLRGPGSTAPPGARTAPLPGCPAPPELHRRQYTARLSGCPVPPELPDGLNFPAPSGLAAAAVGSPSRCDS